MNYLAEFLYEICDENEEKVFYILLGFFIYTDYYVIFTKDLEKLKMFFLYF